MSQTLHPHSPYSLAFNANELSARWIKVVESEVPELEHRPVYQLRFEFACGKKVKSARVRATAQGQYQLFINGVKIGDEELTPGSTDYGVQIAVQTFAVTNLVDKNAIVILLGDGWFRSVMGAFKQPNNFGTHVAALAQLEITYEDGSTEVVSTNKNWRVGTSHITSGDLILGQNEDRRLINTATYKAGFDDSNWVHPEEISVDAVLVAQFAPPVRRTEEIVPVSVKRISKDVQVVDLGQNINGWMRLLDLGPSGTEITLIHGEVLDASGDVTLDHLTLEFPGIGRPDAGQIDRVISAGTPGDIFEPQFTTHGFQFISVVGHPKDLTTKDMVGIVVHSDLKKTGWFESNDARLNWLHEATVWSLRDNMCDVPTDCPTRERAGWTGDWQIFAPTAAYLFDVNDFSRKWLADVVVGQREDGAVPNIAPPDFTGSFKGPMAHINASAGWGDAIIAVPLAMYEEYGDTRALEECWTGAEKWINFGLHRAKTQRHPDREKLRPVAAAHEEFLWDTPYHWGEWLEPGVDTTDFGVLLTADRSDVATPYLHRSAKQMVIAGKILGKPESVLEHYRKVAENTKNAWQKEFITSDGLLNPDTQAHYVRALDFGLAPDELHDKFVNRLVELVRGAGTHLGTGFLTTPYLLPVLADNGHLDLAFELLFQDTPPSWLAMRNRGATTVWELWEGIDKDGKAFASLNHYSKGAVISFLHRYIAGLVATKPAYQEFVVQPKMHADITHVNTRHITKYGEISVEWKLAGKAFTLNVSAPRGTSGKAILPDGSQHVIKVGTNTFTC